ncbi:LssY C-terminal domain-containing protein [Serinibacter arcticus]|uniref:LssY-like C-terminal domain-containing protein n=1 Tax=Serinibacter arcticus TaxID=1655435 RepID=A0A4Z1E5V9_9MICO|nr:LssY C-terminal domain-containing protein [Serinibacter arcticus]TGO06529.1 hypothetical protein SERN_0721 [Serinibacter arcticus]
MPAVTPAAVRLPGRLRQGLDAFFFVLAGLAAAWLAVLVVSDAWGRGWWALPGLVLFWILLAYLVLPRLHRILTDVYVPAYFIGRTRTSDGLLGDPVNLSVLGPEDVLHDVMNRAGWIRADDVTLRSSWRIVTTTLSRRSYARAPVSPLFLFGRQQDFAYQQEVDGNPAKRHHVRFWRCPPGWLLPGGTRVDWLAAGTFDRAVGLSLFTLQVTHRIEADIDVERDHVVASVRAGVPDVTVHLLQDFAAGYHSRNGGGDSVRTDGDLPVIVLPVAEGSPPVPRPTRVVQLRDEPQDSATASAERRKRPAFEGVRDDDLLDRRPDGGVRRIARPSTILFGVVATYVRALVLAATVVELVITGPAGFAAATGGDATAVVLPGSSWTITVVAGAVAAVVPAVLATLVLRGVDLARVLVLVSGCVSLSALFATWVSSGAGPLVGAALLVTPLDILTLLALSGRPAREFCRPVAAPAPVR